jgi:hypothetical protein
MLVRRITVAAAFAVLIVLFLPASSLAAAPVLTRVGSTERHPSATWTLPPGVTSDVIEIATKSDTGSDGSFFTENVVVFDPLQPTQTSWLGSDQLRAGTYHVHVKGFDETGCDSNPPGPCDYFWSNMLTLTIPAVPAKVYAPDCSGAPHFRPTSIIVACGDGNLWLGKIRWSSWTNHAATGAAVYHWNDCLPMCYRGHFHSRSGARITLGRVTRCTSKGFMQFTRMRVTPPASLPHMKPFTEKLSCTFH